MPDTHKVLRALLCFLLLNSCREPRHEAAINGKTMGTTWHFTVADELSDEARISLRYSMQRRLDEIETAITNWHDSPVTRFNASHSTEWQSVPRKLVEM